MATKKSTRGRKKQRPDYSKLVFIIVVCFCAGGFTYGLLEYFFAIPKESQVVEISKKDEISKLEKLEKTKQKTEKFPKTIEPKGAKKIHIFDINKTSKSDQFQDKNLSEASATKTDFVVKMHKKGEKPKLAIVIDDVSTSAHVRGILDTKLVVTPSFFPPTKANPNTPKLSRQFQFFMIHLPTEALDFHAPQPDTLTVKSTFEEIEEVVKKVRQDFPKATFINNHTGSKFTADERSMDMLMQALMKYNFKFIDSVTTAKTKGKTATKKYGLRYAKRDIFIDNIEDSKEIRAMLKLAVKTAKKNGHAIAIGHPKAITISTLKNSKDLFLDVELVYVEEIYDYYR